MAFTVMMRDRGSGIDRLSKVRTPDDDTASIAESIRDAIDGVVPSDALRFEVAARIVTYMIMQGYNGWKGEPSVQKQSARLISAALAFTKAVDEWRDSTSADAASPTSPEVQGLKEVGGDPV